MKKNKIMAIILSGAIIATMAGIVGEANEQSNKNMVSNKVNNILLANHNKNYSVNACVVNGNGKLVLTNKNGDVVSYLSVGEMLKVQSVDGNKSLVTVQETGARGYIDNSNKLDINKGDINNVTTMNKDGYIINVSSKVNLRKGPSMDYITLEGLNNNTPLKIIGKTDQWYRVSIDGEEGYIFEEYIGVENNTQNTNNINANSENGDSIKNPANPNIKVNVTKGINKVADKQVNTNSVVKTNSKIQNTNNSKNLNNIINSESNNNNNKEGNTTSSDTHTIVTNHSGKSTANNSNKSENQTIIHNKSKKDKETTTESGNNKKPSKELPKSNRLPNVPLQGWETGFNTLENKMNACNNNQQFLMNIYTPQNPAVANGETVYVRFANTNEICSGRLISLTTPTGGTTSEYGYFYEVPLYYKNIYKGTLYYGVNTYGYIQTGGFIPVNEKDPINLTFNSGYWSIPNVGNYTGFQNGCYFINGVAQKGFQVIGGNTYYFGQDGQAYIGTHIINGKKYCFSEDGKLYGGVAPIRSVDGLPNVPLKSYDGYIWNKMNTKLANGDIINIYTPQYHTLGSNEMVYSYVQFNNQKWAILASNTFQTINLSNMSTIFVINVKQNGQDAQIEFGENVDGGVQALYKNLQTNKTQTVLFKPGYENA